MRLLVVKTALFLGLLAPAIAARAQYAEPDALITAGFAAYKAVGPEEAIKVWIKESPIDGNKEALNQANNLRNIESSYGPYQSADIIRTRDIAKNVRVLYVVISYGTGPLFGRFVVYHAAKGWLHALTSTSMTK